ncbi:DMT family transporter [Rhizobium populisoli]|uniref:DMT family transporter n=1 Tax=Rhizobium populisoli TaxID=2859785 RepID=UPI0028B01131|nr:DMT family transporter [Rhizobium populisoli]
MTQTVATNFKTSASTRSIAAMVLLAVMWGLSIPITKLGLETVPPLMFTAMRFLVAVPILLILATGRLRVPLRAVPSIVALGVMGITLGNVAQSYGVQGTSASVGTIVSATIPIFIVIFAAVRLG